MTVQELNLVVTIRSNEVFFQVAPVSKEKLQNIKGLQVGSLLPESPLMKCRKCEDQVRVNLFWTKSMVVIGGAPPKEKERPKPKREKMKECLVKPELVEVKEEIVDEKKETKEEPEVEDTNDDFTFDGNCHPKSDSGSEEYEIPQWCAPKLPKPKVPSKRSGNRKGDPVIVLCHICSKEVRKENLKNHLFKHEMQSERPFECNECGKCFASLYSLENHLVQKHFPSLSTFLCPHCPSVFCRQAAFKKHLYDGHRVGNSQSVTCPHCNLVLSNKHNLKSHIITKHTDPSKKKQFTCETCAKIFFKKSHYNSHVRTHLPEEERPYRCWCGSSFISLWIYKRHLIEHEDPQKVLYKCEICHKTFKYGNSLTVHMRIHTGEQPYECKICKRRFGDRGNYRTHMKAHENEMGVKLTLTAEERRLLHHKVLKKEQILGKD